MIKAFLSFNGQEYALHEGINTLGRKEGNDIIFEKINVVSRSHCEFKWDGKCLSVKDSGSRNGTNIQRPNGTFESKIDQSWHLLNDGDYVIICDLLILARITDA